MISSMHATSYHSRYDILTILVEGREPLPEEDQKIQTQRTVFAQYYGLLSIIKWAINNNCYFYR